MRSRRSLNFITQKAHVVSLLLAVFPFLLPSVCGQRPRFQGPLIFANDSNGMSHSVTDDQLTDVELWLREEFDRKDGPEEIIALVEGSAYQINFPKLGEPVGLLAFFVGCKEGELRWYVGDTKERYYRRTVATEEIDAIREFLSDNKVDVLPEVGPSNPDGSYTVGGLQYVYLRMDARRGRRILINNPQRGVESENEYPRQHPIFGHIKLIEYFDKFKDPGKLEVCYEFPRPIDGLEVLFAPPTTDVLAVRMQDGDIRVTLREKWKHDAVASHRVLRDGKLTDEVAAPKLEVENTTEVGGVAIRPWVESTDRRWVVGNRTEGGELVCYDRTKMEFVRVADQQTRLTSYPLYYLDAHDAFLLGRIDAKRIPRAKASQAVPDLFDLHILDPATGENRDVDGALFTSKELWFQELPRQLQPVRGVEHAVWIAVPTETATKIGQFNTKTFEWLGSELIPNLKLETKHLWVDEPEKKVYIVYKGHLLSIPLPDKLMAASD